MLCNCVESYRNFQAAWAKPATEPVSTGDEDWRSAEYTKTIQTIGKN